MSYLKITNIHGREILDSRGNPTVEAEVEIEGYITGRASVPSGASTGRFEAVELRDSQHDDISQSDLDKNDISKENVPIEDWKKRYQGLGVLQAVKNINTEIRECLLEHNALDQPMIDKLMLQLDGTDNKARLGANAILAVSMATARAAANALELPLFQYLGGTHSHCMPVPMMNIVNGGVHAKNYLDFQEFMIMPVHAPSFHEGLRMGVEVYHSLKKILAAHGLVTAVGDEGGFAPDFKDAFEVFEYLMEAVKAAGYEPGIDIVFAMDAAASELYQEDAGMYYFPGETESLQVDILKRKDTIQQPDTKELTVIRSTEEMIHLYEELCDKYPLKSIEDGLNEDDWEGWQKLTKSLGDKVQLVGDDLFVTNTKRLAAGIKLDCANAILVKVNQIGTLTEAFEAVEMAHKAGYHAVISHRSGETEDSFIADIAVALNAGQIKTGAPCRSDRVAKYNQLIRIEEDLAYQAVYKNPFHE